MPDDIGPIVGLVDATRQVETHLRQWLGVYLNRVQTHLNATKPAGDPDIDLRAPRSWRTPITVQQGAPIVADGQLPSVSVVPAGTPSPPRRNGRVWEASWLLDVVVFARGMTYDHTAATVGGYLTSVHLACAQLRDTGLDWCHWIGETIDAIDPQTSRTLGQGSVHLRVGYERVVDESMYPSNVPDPVSDPVDGWPTVETTPLTVDTDVP